MERRASKRIVIPGASGACLDAAHCRASINCASSPPEVPAYRDAMVTLCFAVLMPACMDREHPDVPTKVYALLLDQGSAIV